MKYSGTSLGSAGIPPRKAEATAESSASPAERALGSARVLAYSPSTPVSHPGRVTRASPAAGSFITGSLDDRERYRFRSAVAVTVAFLVMLVMMISLSLGHANVGVTVRPGSGGQWIVASVVPSGISYDIGVRPGDVVLSRNGFPTGRLDPLKAETDLNGATSLEVMDPERDTSASGAPLSISTADRDGGNPLQRWGFALLSLIFIGVGAPVYVKAQQRTAASAFYIFCIFTALALAINIAADLAYGWMLALAFTSLVAWASSFAYFFHQFPAPAQRSERRDAVISSVLIMGSGIVLAAYTWVFSGHPEGYAWVQPLGSLYLVSCVAAGLLRLGKALRAAQSPEVRQQLVLLLGGTAVAVAPTLLLNILPVLIAGHYIVRDEITSLALGLMPLAFAYAITQHQLLGVRSFVRRGVVYVVMGSSVLVVFALSAAALSAVLPEGWIKSELGLIGFGLFVFLIALSFGYLQRRVERIVDRYIYHDAYDYKEALLQLSAQLAAEQHLHVLADELVERTCRLMNLKCGVLLLGTDSETHAHFPSGLGELDIDGNMRSFTGREATAGEINAARQMARESGWSRVADEARVRASSPSNSNLHLEPYSRYGDWADWMLDSLQRELSRTGLDPNQPDAPMQLIYLNGRRSEVPKQINLSSPPAVDELPAPIPGAGQSVSAASVDAVTYRGSDFDSMRSFLGVPLWTRSNFVGVLCLGGKKTGERFTRDDLSLLSTLGSQAALAIYNAQLYETREQALLDTIAALAHAIEAKDNYTIHHCEHMTGRAVALAQAMALPRKEVENIRLGAILHDVGKIGVPDAILNKPSRLTGDEYEIIKQHAAIGARIVQSVGALQDIVPIVRHHQERYDGSGYPAGLVGEAIPMGARIISVVDAYGAMTEDRVYRKAPGHEKALSELQVMAGRQFDPRVVDAFVRLVEEQPELIELEAS